MKILIVDDEPLNRKLLERVLQSAGHEIVEAEDGQSAWDLIQQEPFQLVITDWMMPRLTGTDLVKKIRTSGQEKYTYVILLTSMNDEENIVQGLESGADDYLTKPFNARELTARIASGVRILKLEEELRKARQQMEFLAMQDGLTDVLNRRAIEEFAETEFQKATRKKRPLSVILLDVDHFKNVNDKYGHEAGDTVLRAVAKALAQDIRNYDRLGRWGGEEFILILPETQLADAIITAERLRERIANTKVSLINGELVQVQISLGVTHTDSQFASLAKLIDSADKALYQAKQTGRNKVCTFEEATK